MLFAPSLRASRWALRGFLFLGLFMVFSATSLAATYTSEVYDGIYKVHAIDTEHFTLEYSPKLALATDEDGNGVPDQVDRAAEYAEYSWELEVEGTELPNPLDNQSQETIYIIFDDLGMYLTPGALGVTSMFEDGTLYFAIDPTLSDDVLKVTIAHEFFHVIQFSYQGYFVGYEQDINLAEMTATWAEELVYPEVNDYVWYLSDYLADTDYSIFTGVIPEGSLFEYGLSLWPIFLSEYFEDWTIIPSVINHYFSSDPDIWDTYEAYQAALDELYGVELSDTYAMFALWNYVVGYYSDADYMVQPSLHAYHEASEYPLVDESVDSAEWPALFGTNYLVFELEDVSDEQDFQFSLTKTENVDFRVTLLPETATSYLTAEMAMESFDVGYGGGTITMPLDSSYTQMTVILTPVSEDAPSVEDEDSAFENGYQYFYSVSIDDYGVVDSVEVEVGEGTTVVETDDDKEGDAAGTNSSESIIEETELDALFVSELGISSQTDDSVSLRWTRVFEDSVVGYYVYFGNEAGVYDYYEYVEGAQVTHYTVEDLWPDTYYFAVTAVTEEGTESESYSNEVTTTLEVKSYEDVTEAHDNYYAIRFLSYLGVLEGYEDGTFQPEGTINRAEMMKVMVYGYLAYSPDPEVYQNCFPDVTTEWFAPYVCYAKEQGWVQGYNDSNFHPENVVTRAEALKMIFASFGIEVPTVSDVSELPYEDVVNSLWYAPYLQVAYPMGILEETGASFDGNEGRTRAEVSEEIFRLLVLALMVEDVYTEEVLESFLESWGEFFL